MASSDSNNFINYGSANLDKSFEYGLNINAPFKVLAAWTVSNNAELSCTRYRFNNLPVVQATLYLRSTHTIHISKICDINVFASWHSATRYSNIASPALFYTDLGMSQKMLSKRAALRLVINDLFNSISERERTVEATKSIYFYRTRPTRTIGISFTYNFSFGKSFDPGRIEQGSNELKNRIAN